MIRLSPRSALIALSAFLTTPLMGAAPPPIPPLSERVTFPSADGATMLFDYLFRPQGPHAARMPAVVMKHGRAGVYSAAAEGDYSAMTVSRRHQEWGHLWAQQGYLAILVDGFGPRGYPQGFPRYSYFSRPATLNEVTVRPLDAYGALAWLRKRNDVIPDRIALQGWSNGGSAVLATMASVSAPGIASLTPITGFRGALVFYPACGLKDQFDDGLILYAPVRVFMGSADEEVSPPYCGELIDKSRARGGDIQIKFYRGATHDFDDLGEAAAMCRRTRQQPGIRRSGRKIAGNATVEAAFALPLARASQIRSQQQRQRGWKLYSFHAPETECIGKGKASAPYEFGVKVSIVTTNARAPGGQFVLHAKALPGNPYDGTPKSLPAAKSSAAMSTKGYRGHDTENPRRVFISGQKRGVFGVIKRELRRRSAIEPVIGHMKAEGHLGRCYLKGRAGDAANAILSAVGYNFRRILAWLRAHLRPFLIAIVRGFIIRSALNPAC